jgi:hypothetical protein
MELLAKRTTFGGAIVHIVLHVAEHRGEALHILRRLSPPDLPEVDHLIELRFRLDVARREWVQFRPRRVNGRRPHR